MFTTKNLVAHKQILLRGVISGENKKCLFVTFQPWNVAPKLDDPGFAEAHLLKIGVDALHIVTDANDWFQTPFMDEILEKIREIAKSYDKIVTYGSSMGGYGALNFSKQIGAHVALAIMPQYSIDRTKVPFESRWAKASSIVNFQRDQIESSASDCTSFVFFDPLHHLDRLHVDLISKARRCELVSLPLMGHKGLGATTMKFIVTSVANNNYADLKRTIQDDYRKRKKRLPNYFLSMATRRRLLRPETKINLLLRALDLEEDYAEITQVLAAAYLEAGQNHKALEAIERLLAKGKNNAQLQQHLATALQRTGDIAGANAALAKSAALSPWKK